MNLTVCCADVGSVARGNFGWALRDYPAALHEVASDASIAEFSQAIAERLQAGRSVALGFECPLYVPIRTEPSELTKARRGEGNRPWSAGAGTAALTTGLVQAVWLLTQLKAALPQEPTLTFSWETFSCKPGSLLLWEAFVTRKAKIGSHHGDAGAAVEAFCKTLLNPWAANIVDEGEVLSLIAVAALRAGWKMPAEALEQPCLVIAA